MKRINFVDTNVFRCFQSVNPLLSLSLVRFSALFRLVYCFPIIEAIKIDATGCFFIPLIASQNYKHELHLGHSKTFDIQKTEEFKLKTILIDNETLSTLKDVYFFFQDRPPNVSSFYRPDGCDLNLIPLRKIETYLDGSRFRSARSLFRVLYRVIRCVQGMLAQSGE